MAVRRRKKISFPADVSGGGGNVPLDSAGAESDFHEDCYLLDHAFSANGKTESHDIQVFYSQGS